MSISQESKKGTKYQNPDFKLQKQVPESWMILTVDQLIRNRNDIKTGPFGSSLKKEIFVPEGYKIYGQENVIPDDFSLGNYYITEELFQKMKKYEIKPGDILVSLVGTHGKISLVPHGIQRGIINPRLLRIRFDISKTHPNYMKILMESEMIENQIRNLSHGLTMGIINTSVIKKLVFLIPSLKEQHRIAYILSTVDELIEKIKKIIEKTERLKKGLMQRLLTRGIDHTKFKRVNLGITFLNYSIPSEWRLMKLRDVASVHGRIGWKGLKQEEYTKTGPLMLSVWSLIDSYPYGIDYSEGVNRLSLFRYDESPEIKLQNGDILLAKDGDIGRIGYVKSLPEPSTVNSHVVVVRVKSDEIDNEYLYWYMNSHPFQSYCKSLTSGTTVPLLSQGNIREANIPIPSLIEQKTICSILYNFSNLTYNNKIYKSKIENLKKGLTQQLLTGKIRVKV